MGLAGPGREVEEHQSSSCTVCKLPDIHRAALRSDYDGATAGLFDTSELAVLTESILQTGRSVDEIRKVMDENVKQFLLENIPEKNTKK